MAEPGPPAAVHHQPSPGARTGFVFICPGRHEANRGFPCAAGTGANLNRVLIELHALAPADFASPSRSAYVVTNAWPRVEYPALTGRSVPEVAEVLDPANLARLWSEIDGLGVIVACGQQAQAAVRALVERRQPDRPDRPGLRVAYARHLSQRSVNMISGAADTPGRIRRWSEDVVAQLGAAAGATP